MNPSATDHSDASAAGEEGFLSILLGWGSERLHLEPRRIGVRRIRPHVYLPEINEPSTKFLAEPDRIALSFRIAQTNLYRASGGFLRRVMGK